MKNTLGFREFVEFNNPIDEETRDMLMNISQSHPIIRNHPTMQTIINDKSARISLNQVAQINLKILERSHALAKKAGTAAGNEHFLILAEMNLLNSASSALSSVISTKMQISIERLSKITKAMG